MDERVPVKVTNLDRYGFDAMPWSRPRSLLAANLPHAGTAVFLGTVRPDGRPHSAGIGAIWLEEDLYFTSGLDTVKARNLAANPACTVSVRLPGLDLVLSGEASRVSEAARLERAAALYRTGGWPAEVAGEAFTAPFSAPSAGPAPWHLFRVDCRSAVGVATDEPYGATRWAF